MKRLALAVAVLSACGRHCFAEAHPAVVKLVGGCTAVCVSGSGLIMTAKHCIGAEQKTVTVQFGDRQVSARPIYVSKEPDGPVVFDCAGDGYPFVQVAEQAPHVSQDVYCVGYPGGDTENCIVMRGKVTGGAILRLGLRVNVADFQVMHGMSGCPLFNSRGEVIGLLHGGNASSSVWITTAATQTAYEAVVGTARPAPPRPPVSGGERGGPAANKPTLYVFTLPDGQCRACDLFKVDDRAGHFQKYRIEYVTWHNDRWDRPEIAEAARARTKATLDQAPIFWPSGSDQVRSGYDRQSRSQFLKWLEGVFGALVGVPRAIVDVPPHPSPSPSAGPVPELGDPKSKIQNGHVDWSNVTFVGLASSATPKVLSFLKGPAKRALAELSGGKAALSIVAERTHPARFEAVVEAAGTNPDPLYLLVLVETQELGLKGLVAKLIEEKVRPLLGRQEKLPIDVIFRRAHPDDYAAIEAALNTEEVEHFERSENSGPASSESTGIVDGEDIRHIVQSVVAPLIERVPDHDKSRDPESQDPEPAIGHPKSEDAPLSWLWGLLAGPLAAFRRHYLDRGVSA